MPKDELAAAEDAVTKGEAQPASADVMFWLVAILLSAAVASSMWVVPYLPTNDGPQAVWSSHVAMHANDPLFAKQFEVRSPLAYRGFDLLFEPLSAVLGWRDGLRAYQSLLALGWGWGVVAVAAALHPARRWVGLLGFGFALGWPFYMGFFSFSLASAMALFIVASTLRLSPASLRGRALVSGMLLLQFVAHPVAAAPTGLIVAIIALARAPLAKWRQELVWLALTAIALVLPAAVVSLGEDRSAIDDLGVTLLWEPLHRWLYVLPRVVIAGPTTRAWIGIALLLAGLVTAVRAGSRRLTGELGVLLSASSMLLAGLCLPVDVPGWQYFGPRFFPLGVALAHTLLPIERVPDARRRVAQLLVVACAGLSIATTASMHRKLYDDCAETLAAMDRPVKRDGMLLPIIVESTCDRDRERLRGMVPYNEPLRHVGALFAVQQGGSVPFAFAGSSFHKLSFRPEHKQPTPPQKLWSMSSDPTFFSDDRLHRATLTEQAAYGMHYQSILVFGPSEEDMSLFEARGFEPELRQPGLFVGSFKPCRVAANVIGVAPGERFELSWGVWGLRTLVTLPVTVAVKEGPTSVVVPTLCGDLFVRVGRSENGPTCQGSRPDGRMRVRAERGDGASVDCQL